MSLWQSCLQSKERLYSIPEHSIAQSYEQKCVSPHAYYMSALSCSKYLMVLNNSDELEAFEKLKAEKHAEGKEL